MPLLRRLIRADHPAIPFTLDSERCEGRAGDTVLTAILTQVERLRLSEFSASPRAGFCQMGACQDCWVVLESGERLRACSTALTAGMSILTRRARTA
ncbi:(2Fe-2S)-binding protein [Bosea sp. (in: a-proteobacteria)]|jgi:predicted molibdopterin-dependent oxidoreductase YjgC|uniref:(2Fe-2S)-binding protein n=1 Tax=Bosea sp. (in: a-proteobacteria) TaxID=1871050 RepID=UPI002DDD7B52|nr:(2Fe-2S)-binding protein [Bosea sp. (in: a-proteobacteria)]HEV2510686.1 (2Fe-2S)-binding protein [Bosea sp. (in: a-proteobacteria)]